jgi:hypothetical protein
MFSTACAGCKKIGEPSSRRTRCCQSFDRMLRLMPRQHPLQPASHGRLLERPGGGAQH